MRLYTIEFSPYHISDCYMFYTKYLSSFLYKVTKPFSPISDQKALFTIHVIYSLNLHTLYASSMALAIVPFAYINILFFFGFCLLYKYSLERGSKFKLLPFSSGFHVPQLSDTYLSLEFY